MTRTKPIIRRDTDYALRALLHLAGAGGRKVTCVELSEKCRIPRGFAYKILSQMDRAGLVASSRGRAGGFRLKMSRKKVSLRNIVEAIQGPIRVSQCVLDWETCPFATDCLFLGQWSKFQRSILDFLDGTTLHDVMGTL